MARITNYPTLVSAVVNEMEDDSEEFTAYLPVAIDLAEQSLTRLVDTYGLTVKTTLSTTSSVNIVSKPTDYRLPFQLVQRLSSGALKSLVKVTDEFIVEYWNTPSQVSTELKYYADDNKDYFLIAPTPTSAYTLILKYLARPTALSDSNLTNYYTDFCSDALFYSTLREMCRFTKNYELADRYDKQATDAILAINNEGRRSRRDDDRANSNPEGSQNVVKEGGH